MELVPRDITSRAIAREIRADRGIPMAVLVARSSGICVTWVRKKIMSRFPFIGGSSSAAGIDAVHQPIPVRPIHKFTIAWAEYL